MPGVIDEVAASLRRATPRCGDVRVVCIDGPAGSGKTSLAARLSTALGGAVVVHLDDLYDGWTVDFGALARDIDAWLLSPWAYGRAGRHPVYDWTAGRYASWRDVPADDVVILEGVGAGSAPIRERATMLVWVEAPAELLLDRVLRRDGAALAEPMRGWQLREAAHFGTDGTRAAADLIVSGAAGPTDGEVLVLGP